jgi:mevalonate kinase
MAQGSGFRKTILIGDHFVLYDVPALVAALPFETVTRVEQVDGKGWVLEDLFTGRPGYLDKKSAKREASINRILEVMGIDVKKHPIKIIYGGDYVPGSGLGASAASCVSLVRALNEEFGLGLSIDEINRISWEGEFPYHGKPSGVDNTASTYGGIILYRVKGAQKQYEKIITGKSIHLVLGNSGITTDTSQLRPYTNHLMREDPGRFKSWLNRIREQVFEMKQGLEADDPEKVGAVMTENHNLLTDMGLSHEILDILCHTAIEKGAMGAKVTGGGRGGYMVAISPDTVCQEAIAAAMEKAGYIAVCATIRGL